MLSQKIRRTGEQILDTVKKNGFSICKDCVKISENCSRYFKVVENKRSKGLTVPFIKRCAKFQRSSNDRV